LTEKLHVGLSGDLSPRNAGDDWEAFVGEDGERFVSVGFNILVFRDIECEETSAFHGMRRDLHSPQRVQVEN